MRYEGIVQSWKADRGFGFIRSEQLPHELFVHVSAFGEFRGHIAAGTRVTFVEERGPDGRKRATQVLVVSPVGQPDPADARLTASRNSPRQAPPERPHKSRAPVRGNDNAADRWRARFLVALPAFAAFFVLVDALGDPPRWLALLYLLASGTAFLAYAIDKAAAKNGLWRTPESTLHLLALAGGWPGALLAQELLRHKSRKADFRFVFWLTAIGNILGLLWLASPWRPH